MVREDAAQMCALQMQAEAGPTLLDQSDGLEPYLEKFIVRQVTFSKHVSLGVAGLADYAARHVVLQHERLMSDHHAKAL